MKKIIYIFAIFPLLSFGQSIVTKDSTWQAGESGKFFAFRLTEYANGESVQTKTLIGDTATVFNNALKSSLNEGYRMATVAYEARDFDKTIKGVLAQSDSVLQMTGMNVSDTMTAMFAPALVAQGWVLQESGLTRDITFTVNSNGSLRYQIAGFAQRGATIIANTMRLNNFKDSGQSLDVFRAPGGNFFSIDNRVKIKFPSNQGLNRAAKQSDFKTETIKLEPVLTPENKNKKPAKKKKKQ
jgi:hypothetical protein